MEKKFIITYISESGEHIEREDYFYNDDQAHDHYKATGLDIVSIIRG